MTGENNLAILLQKMHPELDSEAFVFLSSPEQFSTKEKERALMVFQETEGTTLLVEEKTAQAMNQTYESAWAKITLTIHSDLNAVGFLAAILPKLAAAGISVNPVSAFFHDHLFIPWEKRHQAMEILNNFRTQA